MLQIRLEHTLCDFFASEDKLGHSSLHPKVFISYNPISEENSTNAIPRNTKYLIQQWRSVTSDTSPAVNLALMPQRMSWIAGNMEVIFFNFDGSQSQEGLAVRDMLEDDIAETIKFIDSRFRYEPKYCTSLEQIPVVVGDSLIIPFLPSDIVSHLPHYIDPDAHYELLTKRGLALSGLSTPEAQIIDIKPPGAGWTTELLELEIASMTSAIHARPPPFVLKSNSSGGCKGVYIIRTSEDRLQVMRDITKVLRIELHQLNIQNAHLHPFSLILTELLPGQAVSINFYVHYNGQAQFSSCCSQQYSTSGHWHGGAITYSNQAQLADEYAVIIQETASFLSPRGYHGPCGIDVMTKNGKHYIIDLNPRPTGSFVLGCLRPHFKEDLHMDEACVLPFMKFSANRNSFKAAFEKELSVGEIIILAWYSDSKALSCSTCLAVAGRDGASLQQNCSNITKWVEDHAVA